MYLTKEASWPLSASEFWAERTISAGRRVARSCLLPRPCPVVQHLHFQSRIHGSIQNLRGQAIAAQVVLIPSQRLCCTVLGACVGSMRAHLFTVLTSGIYCQLRTKYRTCNPGRWKHALEACMHTCLLCTPVASTASCPQSVGPAIVRGPRACHSCYPPQVSSA